MIQYSVARCMESNMLRITKREKNKRVHDKTGIYVTIKGRKHVNVFVDLIRHMTQLTDILS